MTEVKTGPYLLLVISKPIEDEHGRLVDRSVFSVQIGSVPHQSGDLPLQHMILYAALDEIQARLIATADCFFQMIDHYEDHELSAYVTPGHTYFLLLHSPINPSPVLKFFQNVHQAYIVQVMNPLYEPGTMIFSEAFHRTVSDACSSLLTDTTFSAISKRH